MSDLGNTSKGLRVIADNLDATCMLVLSKTKPGKNGDFVQYEDVCTGVLVKEGFILTSSRFMMTPEDVADAHAVFFFEEEGKGSGKNVPPVSIPLDPSVLFYSSPIPSEEGKTDDQHLGFAVVGLDRTQIRPYTTSTGEGEAGTESPRPLTGQGRPSSAQRRRSIPAQPATLEDSILAFQEIIPLDIMLNNVDMSNGDPVKRPRVREQVIVVEHREGLAKDYHIDVVRTVGDLTLEYSIDRRPKTEARSAGSPIFTQSGQLTAIFGKAGSQAVPHQCTLLNPMLSHMRRHMKACRIKSAQMAKRGDFTLASELMWVAVAMNPSPSGDKVIEGLRYAADIVRHLKIEEGDLSELDTPLICHSHAIEFDPRYTDAYLARGLVLHMQTKYADAVRDFSAAINLEPHEGDYYYYRGHAFYDMGNLDNSIADYNNAISLDGKNPVYYLNRGNAHTDNDNLEQAKKDYTSCIALAPEDENAYFRRGNVHRLLGQLGQAIADYTKVLDLVPDHAAACFQRGLVYYQMAHIDIAQACKLDSQPEYQRHLRMFRNVTKKR